MLSTWKASGTKDQVRAVRLSALSPRRAVEPRGNRGERLQVNADVYQASLFVDKL